MQPLSSKRRSELRAEAHKLSPLVLIGDKGLTDEVVAEIDRSLKAHELIKVRASGGEREQRDAWLEAICERLQAHPVQQIGKVFVIYRERPQEEEPTPKAARSGEKRRPRGEVVSGRGKQAQRSRDAEKQRLRDIADMVRKGKIPPKAKFGLPPSAPNAGARSRVGARGDEREAPDETPSRPRPRIAPPQPEPGPRRRRPRTGR